MQLLGDIPSWLDLGIAVAALAGGGAGGGYLAAQHRARLQDRRTIDDFFTEVAEALRHSAVAFHLQPESAKYNDHPSGWFYDKLAHSRAAVGRLPWQDRAEWLLQYEAISVAVFARTFTPPNDLDELIDRFQPTVDAIAAHRRFSIEHLNPSFGSRWRRLLHAYGLLRKGLAPWRAKVRALRQRPQIDLLDPFESGIDAARHYDQ